ncbi:hypothetical protein L195_g030865 [Trifolium pratense]|uniref:Uncharacterized protein n=1 Tax=Trifolium pratense TaxID=57577 RepID=A0A2K3L8S0_TRIPR|nr:hypothetical protein L195_g030865 [Trifolium pratense]
MRSPATDGAVAGAGADTALATVLSLTRSGVEQSGH